jgi:hypothetical protein
VREPSKIVVRKEHFMIGKLKVTNIIDQPNQSAESTTKDDIKADGGGR